MTERPSAARLADIREQYELGRASDLAIRELWAEIDGLRAERDAASAKSWHEWNALHDERTRLAAQVAALREAGDGVIINAVEGQREGDGWVSLSRFAYNKLRGVLAATTPEEQP